MLLFQGNKTKLQTNLNYNDESNEGQIAYLIEDIKKVKIGS